ncbi:MAG: Site-specific recombinase XerD [Methanothrix harundinacea]|uniref:Site-specific recombinase XerD n=1 Tax=Methanothrix harundinacea TaxID=301375 RepID=A0A124G366_9EURY|nr:MAG: Site-specific recombinase XerD [Methanothrix harundinacea]KUK95995.1 MAG: Site-specific recombinase XerD [Methanothrix harundinacea]
MMPRASDRSSPELDSLVHNELVEQYREDNEIRGLSTESTRRYISSIRIYVKYLEDNGMDLLGADRNTIRKFLEYLRKVRGVHQKTIENYFTGISGFYDFLEYEGHVDKNPVHAVRKRYLRRYKDNDEGQMRQLISVEEMARLINTTMDVRDKAIIALLAKTGIRRRELIRLDVDDIDWVEQSIKLKPTPKRTNRIIFFDDETAFILKRWLRARASRNGADSKPLFTNSTGGRLNRNGVYSAVTKAAERAGLHNPDSERMEDHFSPHCCRHWFTTHMRRAGMPREFIQELRGDVRKEAIDIYDHIDRKELRESYLAHIPQLGI